ncbi:Ldh family oxidoreductase [Roseicyclus mahoneyensis]|uniref:LDH2 family malate/lactate/ureidoglycolate dehydrogenase n=1 Tax=Roseicyclus mahoneyensis TaxID=164332 RepID=A0A316GFJ8_9RHOB|nr:Ldh family oxidoreductase [Roseicyclus mahoneyensis]PWK58150.1 LDH2 family malate/lactate/ureidoglycolate dehydrogenase [Roseicyclus mahoneyensis]
METRTKVAPEALTDFATDCYRALGVADDAARLLADTLVQSDLWGHPSHGVMRLFWYGARLETGATRADVALPADPAPPALGLIDGQDGIGQVVAKAAMEQAIRAAKLHGIAAVSVRRSGHFGTAMYFTKMAAEAGCIGFISTNASAAMAPWGGREKRIGNNPFSWAAPAGRHAPMMVDMANTAVARGKLYVARTRGEAIPEGWAIDADGRVTIDPAVGIAGTILPMAGHKGYAITFAMEVLSGVLSGSAFAPDVVGPYMPEGASGAGHFVMAVDIARLRPLAEFGADMERLIATMKDAPRATGVAEIFYPGEMEARHDATARVEGLQLPADVVQDLAQGAARLGIALPFGI